MKIIAKVNQGDLTSRLGLTSSALQSQLMSAMKESTDMVQEYARKNHRFITRTGDAERSIDAKVTTMQGGALGIVGTTRLLTIGLHEGMKAHTIQPKHKLALRWADGGKFIFSKRVRHPGWKADPFIYNAAEAKKSDIISRFDEAVKKAIGG